MKILKITPFFQRLLLLLSVVAGTIGTGACAYNEVMEERRTENYQLKQQLQAEQERGQRLQR